MKLHDHSDIDIVQLVLFLTLRNRLTKFGIDQMMDTKNVNFDCSYHKVFEVFAVELQLVLDDL